MSEPTGDPRFGEATSGMQMTGEVHAPVTHQALRCGQCKKLLAEIATEPLVIQCSRCKHVNELPPRRA